MRTPKKKALSIQITHEQHVFISKLAIDKGVTITSLIVKYIDYLQARHPIQRHLLHAESKPAAKLDV